MENCFPLTTQKSETPLNQLLLFSLFSFIHLCFSSLIHWDQLSKFLAQLKLQVSSYYREELGYRGIYLLETAIAFPSRADSTSFVPHSLSHVQPTVTVLLSHSALGMRHLLGFNLLPLSPKPPLSQGSYSLLWTATNLNPHKAGKFFYCYYCLSGCLQGGPGVSTNPGDMLLHACTCWPGTSAPTSHQGLGQPLDSCCTVWSGCAAARCHHCWFSHLFLSWKHISKKNQGGHPATSTNSAVFTGKKEIKTSALLLPASNQVTFIFKPCLSSPGHE